MGGHNIWVYWLRYFLFRSRLLSLWNFFTGSDQFREAGFLFSLRSDSGSPSFNNNISLYKTIQPTCVFVPVIKIYKIVPTYISGATHISLTVYTSWYCSSSVSQVQSLECQQIQSAAFFSFRLSDLVGIFSPLCLDFFPVVPLPLFCSLQTSPMLFFLRWLQEHPPFCGFSRAFHALFSILAL